MGYFKSMRDRVDGTIKIQDKEVGSISTQSESIDNSPLEFTGLDSRAVKKYSGNLKLTGRLDKLHGVAIDPNLYELATGHGALNTVTSEIEISPDDELSSYWEVNQLLDASLHEIYLDRRASQSFIARGNKISHFHIELIKENLGLATGITVRIETDNAGNPSGTPVANSSVDITNASITTKAWHKINYADTPLLPVEVIKGTKYWVVVFAKDILEGSATDNITTYYNAVSSGYADGLSKQTADGGANWVALNYDMAFEVVFLTENKLEFETKLTDGTVLETTTMTKMTFPSNEFSIVSGELIVDAGSFEAEDISVKVSLL